MLVLLCTLAFFAPLHLQAQQRWTLEGYTYYAFNLGEKINGTYPLARYDSLVAELHTEKDTLLLKLAFENEGIYAGECILIPQNGELQAGAAVLINATLLLTASIVVESDSTGEDFLSFGMDTATLDNLTPPTLAVRENGEWLPMDGESFSLGQSEVNYRVTGVTGNFTLTDYDAMTARLKKDLKKVLRHLEQMDKAVSKRSTKSAEKALKKLKKARPEPINPLDYTIKKRIRLDRGKLQSAKFGDHKVEIVLLN